MIAGPAARSQRDVAFWKTAAAHALVRRGELERARETAEAARLFQEPGGRWRPWGHPLELGLTALGAARCLVAAGEPESAHAALQEARETFESLGAEPLLAEMAEAEAGVAA